MSLPRGCWETNAIDALFTNCLDCASHDSFADLDGVCVSAHLVIDRAGRVLQYVPFDHQAWHAGVSSWRGRNGCNAFSIGIELVGVDDGPFEEVQYDALTEVLEALFSAYPRLSPDAVVGHQEVAPGRKTDPGPGFDWPRVYRRLAQL